MTIHATSVGNLAHSVVQGLCWHGHKVKAPPVVYSIPRPTVLTYKHGARTKGDALRRRREIKWAVFHSEHMKIEVG
jgi:hypothetical protein